MFQCIPYIACYLHTYLLCSLIPRHFHHPVLNFFAFGGYEIASETTFGPIRCFLKASRHADFHMYECVPFMPIVCTALVLAFQLFAYLTSHTLCRRGLKTNRSLGRTKSCRKEDSEEFFCTVRSYLASFNMSPVCLGALLEHSPSYGTNWQCKASYEWGGKWYG